MPLDPQEVHVATAAVRKIIDSTGYGWYVSDVQCQQVATAVDQAIVDYRTGKDTKPAAEPAAEHTEDHDGDHARLSKNTKR